MRPPKSTILILMFFASLSSFAQPPRNEVSGITPYDFNNIYITYDAQFDQLDHGFYGLGTERLTDSGFGGTFSVHGNWGLQPKDTDGQLMFKFGPQYGYVLHPNIMLSAALRGFIYTYDEKKEGYPDASDQKVNGGITLTPKLHFRCDKFIVGIGYEFGWQNKLGELYHNATISIGYNF